MSLAKRNWFMPATFTLIFMVLVLAVAGCENKSFSPVKVYTDPVTKCQYIRVVDAGITPRMDVNGLQICGERHVTKEDTDYGG